MITISNPVDKLLETIGDHLDIPMSFYQKAVSRHKSLGDWLCRPASRLRLLEPRVSSQGSFRYGTVIRPLLATAEYDLDNVTTLQVSKSGMTQKQLKELYGLEVKEYARAQGIVAPVEEKDRCWRLVYADEASFHLDTVPAVPETESVKLAIAHRGVPQHLAERAIAITDRRHPQYDQITDSLLSSNPSGFAAWFEERVRPSAQGRIRQLVERKLYASIEEVPPFEWKTPLQRSIQILKRHRDVMFASEPGAAPISMIITNLAAHAYAGETDLRSALTNIVDEMPKYVKPTRPRVPNPADPAEDYADKWTQKPELEENFWLWLKQVKIDLARMPRDLSDKTLQSDLSNVYKVALSESELAQIQALSSPSISAGSRQTPLVQVSGALRPWGEND